MPALALSSAALPTTLAKPELHRMQQRAEVLKTLKRATILRFPQPSIVVSDALYFKELAQARQARVGSSEIDKIRKKHPLSEQEKGHREQWEQDACLAGEYLVGNAD